MDKVNMEQLAAGTLQEQNQTDKNFLRNNNDNTALWARLSPQKTAEPKTTRNDASKHYQTGQFAVHGDGLMKYCWWLW